MPQLDIKSFACIDDAHLELNDLTVIIGPQASGKSLICKINYFFNDVITDLPRFVEESASLDDVKHRVLVEFQEWFNPPSWGLKAFSLEYTTGPFVIRISRGKAKGNGPKAKVLVSEELANAIESMISASKVLISVKPTSDAFEEAYRRQNLLGRTFATALAGHGPEYQLYIPAGRSFFTSVGKIVTAFEDRTLLDPVVTTFGRLVTNLREGDRFSRMRDRDPVLVTLERLIAGNFTSERGRQMLVTEDGRSMPLSALSSGQQELFPLLVALRFSLTRAQPGVLYVEEPEAHLFPSAQTELVQMFVKIANRHRRTTNRKDIDGLVKRKVVLTTHSPYVLAKANNLIKAGQLGTKAGPEARKELERIVPANAWIHPGSLSAYAIQGKKLHSIVDDYGLIDGEYIDSVSSTIGMEFDSLLSFEGRQ